MLSRCGLHIRVKPLPPSLFILLLKQILQKTPPTAVDPFAEQINYLSECAHFQFRTFGQEQSLMAHGLCKPSLLTLFRDCVGALFLSTRSNPNQRTAFECTTTPRACKNVNRALAICTRFPGTQNSARTFIRSWISGVLLQPELRTTSQSAHPQFVRIELAVGI